MAHVSAGELISISQQPCPEMACDVIRDRGLDTPIIWVMRLMMRLAVDYRTRIRV